jgi:hypothetical protein
MKSKTTFVFLILVVLAYVVNAQDYTFKVLVNKGNNEMKTGESWTPLKVGSSLKSLDEVKVAENSYLGLVHANGKPLEVKQSGKYKVVDLAARVGGGSSVLNKYTDFILSTKTSKANTMIATGAVHRGPNSIKVFLPTSEQSLIYNDNVTIQWEKEAAKAPYTVTFNSLYGDELFKVETSDNFVTINLDSDKFKNEDNILVKVVSKSDRKESDDHTLKKLSKADKDRIRAALGEFSSDIQEVNALNKVVLAAFYEQNKLLIDAATAYQEAIKLEPSVEMYREDYDAFLYRNQMKTPPKDK